MIAVLFARADSNYKAIPGCDVWDIERNALCWPGGVPVVAHPPCRSWASLRHCAKPREGEKELAVWAVEQVRKFGGVIEHPVRSLLWPALNLPNGKIIDEHECFTLVIDQNWFGHRARKRTKLYICGCKKKDIPSFPIALGEATHTVGLWSGRDRARCRPSISKAEFEHTPPALAQWLVDLARKCGNEKNKERA